MNIKNVLLLLLCALMTVNIYAGQSEWSVGLAYKRHDFTYEYYDSNQDDQIVTKHSGFSFGPAVNYEKAMWDIVFIRLFSKLALGNIETTVSNRQQNLTGHSSIHGISSLFELGYVKTFENFKAIPYGGLNWNSTTYHHGWGDTTHLWPVYDIDNSNIILGARVKSIAHPIGLDLNLKKSLFFKQYSELRHPRFDCEDNVSAWGFGISGSILIFNKLNISPGYEYTKSSSGEHFKKSTRHDFVLNLMWII